MKWFYRQQDQDHDAIEDQRDIDEDGAYAAEKAEAERWDRDHTEDGEP